MKHLKIKGEVAGIENIKVTVLEQTHFDGEFGNGGTNFRVSSGHTLVSHFLTSPCFSRGASNIWLGGTNNGRSFIIHKSQWATVKKAVEEYNEWGKTQS